MNTVEPVVSGHSKIDKTQILMTIGNFDLHLVIMGLKTQFLVLFFSRRLRQVLLCTCNIKATSEIEFLNICFCGIVLLGLIPDYGYKSVSQTEMKEHNQACRNIRKPYIGPFISLIPYIINPFICFKALPNKIS